MHAQVHRPHSHAHYNCEVSNAVHTSWPETSHAPCTDPTSTSLPRHNQDAIALIASMRASILCLGLAYNLCRSSESEAAFAYLSISGGRPHVIAVRREVPYYGDGDHEDEK